MPAYIRVYGAEHPGEYGVGSKELIRFMSEVLGGATGESDGVVTTEEVKALQECAHRTKEEFSRLVKMLDDYAEKDAYFEWDW